MIPLNNSSYKRLLERFSETEYNNLPKVFQGVFKRAYGIKCKKCQNVKSLWNYVDFNSDKCNNCLKKENDLKIVMEVLRGLEI